jgi:dsRNA-specific ribonuclease
MKHKLNESINESLFNFNNDFNVKIIKELSEEIFITQEIANTKNLKGPKALAMVGDNVLKLLLTLKKYKNKDKVDPEKIEQFKQKYENDIYLMKVVKQTTLKDYFIYKKKKIEQVGLKEWSTYFEAIIGGIYLSHGLSKVDYFLGKIHFFTHDES